MTSRNLLPNTLQEAQAAAISLALDDDDDDDDESINGSFIRDQAKVLEKKSPMTRSNEIKFPRNGLPNDVSDDDQRMQLRWSRAQAIASALGHLDSDDDNDESLQSSTMTKMPKVNDIFTQMYSEGDQKPSPVKITRRLPLSDSTRKSLSSPLFVKNHRPRKKKEQEKANNNDPEKLSMTEKTFEESEAFMESLPTQEGLSSFDAGSTNESVSSDSSEPSRREPTTTTKLYNKIKVIYLIIGIVLVATMVAVTVLVPKESRSNESVGEENKVDEGEAAITVADVPETICTEQVPGQDWNGVTCGPQPQGSGVCNLVAQGFLDQVQVADIALQNSGNCQLDILKGKFTKNNAYYYFPKNNMLCTLTTSGENIRHFLEQSIAYVIQRIKNNQTAEYPYFAGLRFSVNVSSSTNQVYDIEVNQRMEYDEWKPLDLTSNFTIVSNELLFQGYVEGMTAFKDIENDIKVNKWSTQTFIDYAKEKGKLVAPRPEDYSTQMFLFN